MKTVESRFVVLYICYVNSYKCLIALYIHVFVINNFTLSSGIYIICKIIQESFFYKLLFLNRVTFSMNVFLTYHFKSVNSQNLARSMKEGRMKEMFYLTMHSTHFIYSYMVSDMVKDHSARVNPLPQHRLLFPNSSKGSSICTILQTE